MATCSTAMLVSTLRRIEMGEMARRVILTTAAAITAAVTSGARIAGTGRPTVPLTKSGYIPTVRHRGGTAAASRRAGDERRKQPFLTPMARTPTLPPRDQIAGDAPLRLDVAAALAYPDGSMKASGLRKE